MGRGRKARMARAAVAGLIPFLGAAGLLLPLLPPPSPAGATTAAAIVPARPSAGCAVATPAAPGTQDLLLAAGGDDGAYVREIPPSYSGRKALPVVIDLHGYEEPATLQVSLTQLGTYGASHGFITITPQVVDKIPMWDTTLGGKDLAFIGGLITTVEHTLCVDRNRVYVTGYSNGAFLTSSIACQFSAQVAAVAAVSGLENPAGCHTTRPVPVLAFHGTADQYVSYTGGLGPAGLALPAPDGSSKNIGQELGAGAPQRTGPSVPAITAAWAKRDGCARTPHDHVVASDVTLIAYTCPDHGAVELYRVTGGGHTWPGSTLLKDVASLGHTTFSISADRIMWRFFQAHPLRG